MSGTRIVRRSMSARQTGQTDWARLNQMTESDVETQAATVDTAPVATEEWLARAELVTPAKRAISIRLDADVLDYFQQGGGRYQTRINQVLRAYMETKPKT